MPLPVAANSFRKTSRGNFLLPSVATLSIKLSIPAFLSVMLREPPRMNKPAATVGELSRRLTITFKPFTSNSVTSAACSLMLDFPV